MERKLTYGSIVRLIDESQKYGNDIFFIENVNKNNIILITKQTGMFQLFLEDDVWKDEEGIVIENIVVLFHQTKGYALLNDLVPGVFVRVEFENNEYLNGKITALEQDMITIDDLYYIDFKFSGIHEDYHIQSIRIADEVQHENQLNEYNVQEEESIEDRETIFIYDRQQQIDDYVEKMSTKTHDKKVEHEIHKYIQLLDTYTDLSKQKRIKLLPENQVHESFKFLNKKFLYPVSSHVSTVKYSGLESSKPHVIFKYIQDINDEVRRISGVKNDKEKMSFLENLIFESDSEIDHHFPVKIVSDTPLLRVRYPTLAPHYTISTDINDRRKYPLKSLHYTKENLNKGDIFFINGVAFHDTSEINVQMNIQHGENILSKSVQNLHPYMGGSNIESINDEKNITFQAKKIQLFNIKNSDKNWKSFIQSLNMNLKEVYTQTRKGLDMTTYDVMRHCSLLNVDKVTNVDMTWMNKTVRRNIQSFKSNVQKKNTTWKSIDYVPYVFQYKQASALYPLLCDYYDPNQRIISIDKNHPCEIFQQSHMDSGKLLMSHLQESTSKLRMKFSDEEINEEVQKLQIQLDEKLQSNNNSIKVLNEYVKEYETLEQLQEDEKNKILLKDVDKYANPVQYLFFYIHSKTKDFGSDVEFAKHVREMLRDDSYTQSEETMNDVKEKVFGLLTEPERTEAFISLQTQMAKLQIRKDDKCFVKENKTAYVYNGSVWESLDMQEEKLKRKKVLRIKNTDKDFENIKVDILNDYALNLIRNMQNERVIHEETDKLRQYNELTKYKAKLIRLKNDRIRHILSYNNTKLSEQLQFNLSAYLTHINPSPYLSLLYHILSYEDLSQKYSLLNRFITLLTVERDDNEWLYCALKESRLVPKFYKRLIQAYMQNNHEAVLRDICNKECYCAGDMYIHKTTGMTVRKIDFDTNYGYDENGFKITLDEVPEQEDKDHDQKEDVLIEDEDGDYQLRKEIVLNYEEKEMYHFALSMMKIIGLRPFMLHEYEYIQVMNTIYKKSMKKDKSKGKDIKKNRMYVILSFLLIYVQCMNIHIKTTFSGCHTSFDGFPLLQSSEKLDGLNYLSCILAKVSKNNTSTPYESFQKMNKSEITDELFQFIEKHMLPNAFINSMIENKRKLDVNLLLFEEKDNQDAVLDKFIGFSPPLRELRVKQVEVYPKFKKQPFTFSHYTHHKDYSMFLNVQIQEFIQNQMKKQVPLLSNTYKEPFMVNFCCSQTKYILQHLCSSEDLRNQFQKLMKDSSILENIMQDIRQFYLKNPFVSFIKNPIKSQQESIDHSVSIDETVVYAYMIHHGHFDTSKDISSFLKKSEIIKEKPDKESYDASAPLEEKIKILKSLGYNFTMESVIEAFRLKALEQFQEFQSNKEEQEEQEEDGFIEVFNEIKQMTQSEHDASSEKYKAACKVFTKAHNIKFQKCIEFLEEFDMKQDKDLYVSFLKNVNYALLRVIPHFLLNHYFSVEKKLHSTILPKSSKSKPSKKSLTYTHWKLNDKHEQKLEAQLDEYNSILSGISLTENTKEFLSVLKSQRSISEIESFDHKTSYAFSFQQCLFYKLLHMYSMLDMDSPRATNKSNIHEVNQRLYTYILNMYKYYGKGYEYLELHHKRLKQSEKHKTTDELKKKSKQEREVETQKMRNKLGRWAVGQSKQIFRYDATIFEEEDNRAASVKNIMYQHYGKDDVEQVIEDQRVNSVNQSLNERYGRDDSQEVAINPFRLLPEEQMNEELILQEEQYEYNEEENDGNDDHDDY